MPIRGVPQRNSQYGPRATSRTKFRNPYSGVDEVPRAGSGPFGGMQVDAFGNIIGAGAMMQGMQGGGGGFGGGGFNPFAAWQQAQTQHTADQNARRQHLSAPNTGQDAQRLANIMAEYNAWKDASTGRYQQRYDQGMEFARKGAQSIYDQMSGDIMSRRAGTGMLGTSTVDHDLAQMHAQYAAPYVSQAHQSLSGDMARALDAISGQGIDAAERLTGEGVNRLERYENQPPDLNLLLALAEASGYGAGFGGGGFGGTNPQVLGAMGPRVFQGGFG